MTDYLNPDGSLVIAQWAEHGGDDLGHAELHVRTNRHHEHPMYGSTATGNGLVSNGLLGVDHIRVPAGGGFAPHTHPGDHLLIVTGGLGTITYDGRIYPTKAGEVYMVEGEVPHAVGAITDHTILAVGSPHRPVQSADRMTLTDYASIASDMGTLTCLICHKTGTGDELTEKGCRHAPIKAPAGKMLIVGIAPGAKHLEGNPAFYRTKSGARLADMLGVDSIDQLLDRVDTTNVFKGYQEDWQALPRTAWREASVELSPELWGRVVVACGHKVAEACGATGARWGAVERVQGEGWPAPALVLTIPHPSSRSRLWNEPELHAKVATALAVARTLASAGSPSGLWEHRDAEALEAITLPAFADGSL